MAHDHEEWFLTRSRPFAQRRPHAAGWTALAEACRRVTKSPGQSCQAEKCEIRASGDNRVRRPAARGKSVVHGVRSSIQHFPRGSLGGERRFLRSNVHVVRPHYCCSKAALPERPRQHAAVAMAPSHRTWPSTTSDPFGRLRPLVNRCAGEAGARSGTLLFAQDLALAHPGASR